MLFDLFALPSSVDLYFVRLRSRPTSFHPYDKKKLFLFRKFDILVSIMYNISLSLTYLWGRINKRHHTDKTCVFYSIVEKEKFERIFFRLPQMFVQYFPYSYTIWKNKYLNSSTFLSLSFARKIIK